MVESLDVVVAYRTDPHVDQPERGGEAAVLLHEL
jgi:microcystin degradation protein MlrC